MPDTSVPVSQPPYYVVVFDERTSDLGRQIENVLNTYAVQLVLWAKRTPPILVRTAYGHGPLGSVDHFVLKSPAHLEQRLRSWSLRPVSDADKTVLCYGVLGIEQLEAQGDKPDLTPIIKPDESTITFEAAYSQSFPDELRRPLQDGSAPPLPGLDPAGPFPEISKLERPTIDHWFKKLIENAGGDEEAQSGLLLSASGVDVIDLKMVARITWDREGKALHLYSLISDGPPALVVEIDEAKAMVVMARWSYLHRDLTLKGTERDARDSE